MTMPSSGPLNMGGTSTPVSVAQELGLGLTTTISMNQTNVRTLAGVSTTSGTSWSMNSLYGKSNRVTSNITISANTQNYVLNTAKVTGYSAGKTDVTLTINSGIYVGSSTTGGIGLDVDTSWSAGDTITIVNNGFIVGAGGAGGGGGSAPSGISSPGAAGGAGGAALRAQRAVTINNANIIGGGGGGGGGGASGAFLVTKTSTGSGGGGGGGGGQGYNGGGAGGGGAGYFYDASVGVWTPTPAYNGAAGSAGTTAGGGGGGAGYSSATAGGSGASYGAASSGAGGACTTSGSNANITWTATGTRYGSIG